MVNLRKSSLEGLATYVLAQQNLAATAVEAVTAKFRVVGSHTVTDLETLDILHCRLASDACVVRGTNEETDLALGSNNTNGLMTGDKWELGNELSLVNVLDN